VELAEADNRLLAGQDQLRPFGVGNTTPVWASAGVRVLGRPRVVGKGHLKLLLAAGGAQREAIAWGMAERPLPEGPLDVCFQLKQDSYLGQDRLTLVVQDFRPAVPAAS
jgi:single-stranded-DNA-specific exonuclease